MPRLILFDVNETLLDLSSLKPHFGRIFGNETVISQWFGQLLRSSMVSSMINDYHDFETLGRNALNMVAQRHQIALTQTDENVVLAGMGTLQPHSEVPDALKKLKSAGLRLAALTNSPPALLKKQLTHAGLIDLFEQTLSVDPTRRFKPSPEPYQYAAAQLNTPIHKIRMVAAHDWDIAGAMAVGMAGAFVARPNMVIGPLQTTPNIIGSNLSDVVDQIIEIETHQP